MWAEASDQNRAQMSHLALLGYYSQAGKNPPSYFSKQFQKVNSRKFPCTGFSEVPLITFNTKITHLGDAPITACLLP